MDLPLPNPDAATVMWLADHAGWAKSGSSSSRSLPLASYMRSTAANIKEVSCDYAIDGQHAAGRPKIVQGALMNDGGRESNAKVEWLASTTLSSL